MSVKSCEKIEKSQVVLTIEVGAPEFEAAIEKAYQKMRKKINVPGFRPGKAPRKIIEGMYGAEVFFEEAINIAFPEAYEAAVKEQELQVVGYPSVEIEGQVTRDGFTFKATAPVYPEVTLGQYKGLSAPKEEVKVSAADVDERLKALTDRNTRLVSVDREAKEGDTVVIDFEGFLEGKPFEGGKGENFSLELGSHTFVPGFEEQLVGVKAGDEKDLDITFPEDYHKDLAGKAVVFKVKVHEVKEKEIPALDDEFAKDVSEFDTLKDLKADLKKKIAAEREETVKRAFEDALMEQVAENITAWPSPPGPVPPDPEMSSHPCIPRTGTIPLLPLTGHIQSPYRYFRPPPDDSGPLLPGYGKMSVRPHFRPGQSWAHGPLPPEQGPL